MSQSHPDKDAASVLNLRERTVRVFSDGVPERDYPEGCQLLVRCDRKVTERDSKKQGQALLDAQTHSGKQCVGNRLSCPLAPDDRCASVRLAFACPSWDWGRLWRRARRPTTTSSAAPAAAAIPHSASRPRTGARSS